MDLSLVGLLLILSLVVWLILRTRRSTPTDFNDPSKILAEVEIYLHYGRKEQAIKLLRNALANGKGKEALAAKLFEIENSYLGRRSTVMCISEERIPNKAFMSQSLRACWGRSKLTLAPAQ